MRYQVYDRKTGDVVGTYETRRRATRRADRLDNEYGAYRYGVRPVLPMVPVPYVETDIGNGLRIDGATKPLNPSVLNPLAFSGTGVL
jgi:hypothetical protein